MNNFKC